MTNNDYELTTCERNGNGQNIEEARVMTAALSTRETAEIQSRMTVAKRFPRNEIEALDKIKNDCQRISLASKSMYQYSRGGTDIQGASIHLARAIARRWGNVDCGIKELERRRDETLCEAYCIDFETNTKESKIFTVPHIRSTKKGSYKLEDPRDIYELVANNGARRERACILAVIPGDIVDEAIEQCQKTLTTQIDITPESIKQMLDAFNKYYGVSKTQIETKIQRRIEAITPAQFVSLNNIYNSLRDNMSVASEWFEPEEVQMADDKDKEKKPKNGNAAAEAALSESLV